MSVFSALDPNSPTPKRKRTESKAVTHLRSPRRRRRGFVRHEARLKERRNARRSVQDKLLLHRFLKKERKNGLANDSPRGPLRPHRQELERKLKGLP